MNYYANKTNNTLYPNCCFSMNHYKYKRISDKIDKLKKDCEMFLDNNKKMIKKSKKKYYSSNISRLFRKLVFDSTNKVLKNYNNKNEKNNKRFFSAKEIQKYKDKKMIFLRLIRANDLKKNEINKSSIDRNTLNSNKYLKRNNTLLSFKDFSNQKDFKITPFNNKSSCNESSLLNIILKQKSQKNRRKVNFKEKVFDKKDFNISLIENQNSNNFNNNEGEKIINSYNDKNNNYFDEKDYISLKKQLNLKKLKININKFENSLKYFPNSDAYNSALKANRFINKKYLKNHRLDETMINKIDINNNICNKFKKRRNISAPKNIQKLNKIMIPLKNNNSEKNKSIDQYNANILIKKINDIQNKMKIK